MPFLTPIPIQQLREISKKTSLRVRFGEKLLRSLLVVAWVAMVLALARPQYVRTLSEVELSGRDLMLTLDLSGSMAALDFRLEGKQVNRLTALKSVVDRFLADRPGDRIGLVVFGDKVFLQCPLTTDARAVREYIRALEIGMAGNGTAIGDALVVSLKRIRDIPEHSKVIVLVTDGKSNAGLVQPGEAVKLVREQGIKVHVVGIGGPEPAPFPTKDMFGVTRLVNQKVDYDEETLRMIAAETGGVYFNAKDTKRLEEVYREIDKLERRSEKSYQSTLVTELFMYPLSAAIFVLILASVLRFAVLRRAVG